MGVLFVRSARCMWRYLLTLHRSITWLGLLWLIICIFSDTAVAREAAARSDTPCRSHAAANGGNAIRICLLWEVVLVFLYHSSLPVLISMSESELLAKSVLLLSVPLSLTELEGKAIRRFRDAFLFSRLCKATISAGSIFPMIIFRLLLWSFKSCISFGGTFLVLEHWQSHPLHLQAISNNSVASCKRANLIW